MTTAWLLVFQQLRRQPESVRAMVHGSREQLQIDWCSETWRHYFTMTTHTSEQYRVLQCAIHLTLHTSNHRNHLTMKNWAIAQLRLIVALSAKTQLRQLVWTNKQQNFYNHCYKVSQWSQHVNHCSTATRWKQPSVVAATKTTTNASNAINKSNAGVDAGGVE